MEAVLLFLKWLGGKIPPKVKFALVAAVTISLCLLIGAWHERGIGEEKCKKAVAAAEVVAVERGKAIQAKADADAKRQDDPIRAALEAPPVAVLFGCKFTQGEVKAAKEKLL